MSLHKKLNSRASTTAESGFASNSSYSGGRFYNKDGSPNLSVKGVSYLERLSLYNSMLNVSTTKFIFVVILFYLLVNLIFAFIYTLVGVEHLGGIEQQSGLGKFWEAFFFSAQTLSTVGYGHVYPKSLLANSIAATESIMGLLTFALGTGMLYGRFSKPKAFIKYSKNALLAPFENGTAIMFRMVPYKSHYLMDAEVKLTLVMKVDENGMLTNRFYNLPLEYSRVNSLTLSWTVVHPINEDSPFFNLNIDDLNLAQAELMVFVKAFDESFSNTVVSRTSYLADEFVFGGKFVLMYNPNEQRNQTLLDITKLDEYEKVDLPAMSEKIFTSSASS
jgi:inward rectifier potassium channel